MRLVNELQQPEPHVSPGLTRAMHTVAREARTIEGRLSKGDWIVGDAVSAADLAIYPCIRLLHRALLRPGAHALATRFLPAETTTRSWRAGCCVSRRCPDMKGPCRRTGGARVLCEEAGRLHES
jgi:glutathione S-transferase